MKGEVERVIWNHYNPYQFFAADGKGFIYNFDCRQEKRLWVEKAHSKEVTGKKIFFRFLILIFFMI